MSCLNKIFILWLAALSSFTIFAQGSNELKKGQTFTKRLLFIPFQNQSQKQSFRWVEKTVIDNIYNNIKNQYRFIRIPQASLERYLAEHKTIDLRQEKVIAKLGKSLGAHGVIFGHFSHKQNKLEITGKIMSVVDQDIVAQESKVTPVNASMFTAVEQLSLRLARGIKDLFLPSNRGALTRSALLPGWGQFYKQRTWWGYFWAISTGTALTGSGLFTILYVTAKSSHSSAIDSFNASATAYNNASTGADFDSLYSTMQNDLQTVESKKQTANQYYSIMTTLYISTLVIYAANLLDAYIFDGDYTHLLKPRGQANHSLGIQNLYVSQRNQRNYLGLQFAFN